jgi:uncharacterized protein YndB with AHSA1/START domain
MQRKPKAVAAAASRTKKVTRRVIAKTAPRRAQSEGARHGGVSSEAVEKATGRSWEQWLRLLDKAGAAAMTHKEIAALAHEKFGASPWWAQMVTVGYEQARGLREKHQTAKGYQVSGSKVINVPLAMLYEAWADEKLRRKWMGDVAMTVRKATPGKSIRITWEGSKEAMGTSVEVNFYAKGAGKSSVQVGHTKIKTPATGEKLKKFWGERLVVLKRMLEGA